jgi:hypothetical protein
MGTLHLFAGIDFNTGIRGILVVLVAIIILPGSVYLLLSTNMGSRLGLLVALAAVFGWCSILTMTWWITSPANGPRGRNASWKPVEVFVGPTNGENPQAARTEVLDKLTSVQHELPNALDIINAHPEIRKNYPNPNQATLSDIAGNDPEILAKYMTDVDLNGWRIVPQSSAGDAATVADTVLTTNPNLFKLPTDYKHLATFDYGGKPTRAEYCGAKDAHPHNFVNGDSICRIQYKLSKLLTFRSPTHYEVVQVQQVIPQVAVPGHAPPLPQVDPTQPVISVVLVRDLGQARLLPAVMFIIAFTLFIFFVVLLHYRDKTLQRNMENAKAIEAKAIEAEAAKV